ncbi:MAG: DUF4290 domain-containing protein [Bacteroidales bacterium]|nr:DUF4290 domain-containing protein [Bacteroidales bacterium]MDO4212869.1 DUF4290 domain-containing protein [Bacteroidales bacterium]
MTDKGFTNVGLDYNTEREKLIMPEYGRNVLKMVETLKTIEDRQMRTRQARAVVKVMEILNPQVHLQDNYEQKLWDHLYLIAGFDLDVDSPYPCPEKEQFESVPVHIPMKGSRIRATHYGRNIEKIIDLLCEQPEGETKTELIRSLAIYMRQQYLIWNKDSVADETIFADIEKLSDYRLKVPEGINLTKISSDVSFAKPSFGVNVGQSGKGNRQRKNNRRQGKKK